MAFIAGRCSLGLGWVVEHLGYPKIHIVSGINRSGIERSNSSELPWREYDCMVLTDGQQCSITRKGMVYIFIVFQEKEEECDS